MSILALASCPMFPGGGSASAPDSRDDLSANRPGDDANPAAPSSSVQTSAGAPPNHAPPPSQSRYLHWTQRLQETTITIAVNDDSNESSLPIEGGSDQGQLGRIGASPHRRFRCVSGRLEPGALIVDVEGQNVCGYTRNDIEQWLRHCCRDANPCSIRTVPAVEGSLTGDLRAYLSTRFQKGSADHELQNTIRDHLYLRTVPVTTRPPRQDEVPGVDYTFLSVEEFVELERSGNLLESGIYEGHHYGTPRPAAGAVAREVGGGAAVSGDGGAANNTSAPSGDRATSSRHPNSEGKRRRNRSTVEAMASGAGPTDDMGATVTGRNDQPQPAPEYRSAPNQNISTDTNGPSAETDQADADSELGPLPEHWEKAYTEFGECYFIDHQSGTSHWLDPRLARVQKSSLEECEEYELPYGWERIDDPTYGTYYIDHVNRRTQYENPVTEAKRRQRLTSGDPIQPEAPSSVVPTQTSGNHTFPRQKKSNQEPPPENDAVPADANQRTSPPYGPPPRRGSDGDARPFFTRDPAQLRGAMVRARLYKSPQGLGFTIVGGDNEEREEFLQIKSVVPNGPAWRDGQLCTGDVLVYVNSQCVLGYTHRDMVQMFQTIPPGSMVQVELCRGYPLAFDPDDPNTEIVTTVAVNANDNGTTGGRSYGGEQRRPGSPHNSEQSITTSKSMPDLSGRDPSSGSVPRPSSVDILSAEPLPVTAPKPRFFTIPILKGDAGFGFTIADSAHGQRVKKVLDQARCTDLREGDILVQINHAHVRNMPHVDVVQVLKDCPINHAASVTVQRGGSYMAPDHRPHGRRPQSALGNPQRSHTPTTDRAPPAADHYKHAADPYSTRVDPYSDMTIRPPAPDGTEIALAPQESSPGYLPMQRLRQPDGRVQHPSYLDGDAYPDRGYRTDNLVSEPRPLGSYSGDNRQYSADSAYGGSAPPLLINTTSNTHRTYQPTSPRSEPGVANVPYSDNAPYWGQTTPQGDGWVVQNSDSHPHKGGDPLREDQSRDQRLTAGGGVSYNNYAPSQGDPHGRRDPLSQPFSYLRPNGSMPTHSASVLASNHGQADFHNNNDAGNQAFFQQRKQSTSFELENPMPSTVTRVCRPPLQGVQYVESSVTLPRHESGFGFRIVGGTEENSQASIGHIVPGGAADMDGRLQTGDEIVYVDHHLVIGSSHHHVVQLMSQAAAHGRVQLGIRRRVSAARSPPGGPYPYEVVVNRRQGEGFGFVIISSAGRTGATIGRIMEGSPAERCGRLRVADRILAVNGTAIGGLHHDQIVCLVKEGGYRVQLTVGAPSEDCSSTASTPHREDECLAQDGQGPVELHAIQFARGYRGFGFSIRGGREFHNMPLFVLRIADNGPAAQDGRLRVGDQIIEINQTNTKGMTHGAAIELIKQGTNMVRLLVQRGIRMPPNIVDHSAPSSLTSSSAGGTGRSSSLSQPYPAPSSLSHPYPPSSIHSHPYATAGQPYTATHPSYPPPPAHHQYPPHARNPHQQQKPSGSSYLPPPQSLPSEVTHPVMNGPSRGPPRQPPAPYPTGTGGREQDVPQMSEPSAYWRRQENV